MATLLLWASILLAVPAQSPGSCYEHPSSLRSAMYSHIVTFNPSSNRMHLIGGMSKMLGTTTYIGPIARLNLNQADSNWVDVSRLDDLDPPVTRMLGSGTVAMVGNKAYIVGAYVYPSDPGKIYVYDTDRDRWDNTNGLTRPPIALQHGCVTTNTTHLFMADGSSSESHTPHIHIYDIAADAWSSQAVTRNDSTNTSGWYHQYCAIVDQQLYMLGGYKSGTYRTDIYRMDLQTLQVELLEAKLPKPQGGGVAVAHAHLIYLVSSYQRYAEILVFDTITGNVSVGFDTLVNVSSASAITANNRLYQLGGSRSASFTSNDIEICDLPTPSPTTSPTTAEPSSDPTPSPTSSPTSFPSAAPSSAPSLPPSSAPTSAPSTSPSSAPSVAPSSAPTSAPSTSPSAAPSFSPTSSPTRYPTVEWEDAYDSVVALNYTLANLSLENVNEIAEDAVAVMLDIERLIERGYVVQPGIVLGYRLFWLRIHSIDEVPVADFQFETEEDTESSLQLSSEIFCGAVECDYLIEHRDDEALSLLVSSELQHYFALRSGTNASSEAVTFSVASMGIAALLNPVDDDDNDDDDDSGNLDVSGTDDDNSFNVMFYIPLCLITGIMLCAVYAACFNHAACLKIPGAGCHVVDDGNYRAVLYFALHLFDFLSDINLSVEIWLNPAADIAVNRLLFVVATASVVFVALPYAVNIYHASKIKQYVEGNECAQMYLERSTGFFSVLVVLSGGCYASIALCSSNIFGLRAFSAGLTQAEMKKLRRVRMSSYFLENIPQIAVQILYATVIGTIDSAVIFAFVASVLSVLSALLNYCVEREHHVGDHRMHGDEKNVVWYYLVMQLQKDNVGQYTISADERNAIKKHKGRRKKMIDALGELFSVLRQNIEIARTDLTKYGAIVFVCHTVYVHELLLMPENSSRRGQESRELQRASLPQLYLSRLYASHRVPINELFRAHFGLSEDFCVRQQYDLSAVKKGIWMVNQNEGDLVDADATQEVSMDHALPLELDIGTAGAIELSAK